MHMYTCNDVCISINEFVGALFEWTLLCFRVLSEEFAVLESIYITELSVEKDAEWVAVLEPGISHHMDYSWSWKYLKFCCGHYHRLCVYILYLSNATYT